MHCLSINSSPSIATHTHSLATTPLRLNVFAFSFFKFCFLGILVFFSLRGAFFFYYSPSFQRLYYTSDLPLYIYLQSHYLNYLASPYPPNSSASIFSLHHSCIYKPKSLSVGLARLDGRRPPVSMIAPLTPVLTLLPSSG